MEDHNEMLKLYFRWPDAILDAIQRSQEPPSLTKPSLLAVIGMGGSAIGGDLLRDILYNQSDVPIYTCRDYHLPAWVSPSSLVIAVSYSGNTEEALVAFSEAFKRGCKLVAITSGGTLGQLCAELKVPVVKIPKGYPPRAALPYLFIPMCVIAERAGLTEGLIDQAGKAAKILKSILASIQKEAKRIAKRLVGTIPIVYGFGIFKSVAYRLKTQFNENSKVPSFANWFPALNHDEIVGWEGEGELLEKFSVILIRSKDEPLEIKRRIELTREIALYRASEVLEIWSRGEAPLEQVISVLLLGEIASVYLALLRRVDPLMVRTIDTVKKYMSELQLVENVRRELLSLKLKRLAHG